MYQTLIARASLLDKIKRVAEEGFGGLEPAIEFLKEWLVKQEVKTAGVREWAKGKAAMVLLTLIAQLWGVTTAQAAGKIKTQSTTTITTAIFRGGRAEQVRLNKTLTPKQHVYEIKTAWDSFEADLKTYNKRCVELAETGNLRTDTDELWAQAGQLDFKALIITLRAAGIDVQPKRAKQNKFITLADDYFWSWGEQKWTSENPFDFIEFKGNARTKFIKLLESAL